MAPVLARNFRGETGWATKEMFWAAAADRSISTDESTKSAKTPGAVPLQHPPGHWHGSDIESEELLQQQATSSCEQQSVGEARFSPSQQQEFAGTCWTGNNSTASSARGFEMCERNRYITVLPSKRPAKKQVGTGRSKSCLLHRIDLTDARRLVKPRTISSPYVYGRLLVLRQGKFFPYS